MTRAMLVLAAVAAAFLIAQRALATRRTAREKHEANAQIEHRQADGGNSALFASGMDDAFGP